MTEEPTVLVVDDLEQNVRLLDAVLSPRGYNVESAFSGQEALRSLDEHLPDIVLLDILMPGIDGYAVCRRIREDPRTAFLPVIMITASGDQEKVRAIEAGADDFITKPFDQSELLARVRSLIRIKQYHDTIENQALQLLAWNRDLEERVETQVQALERVNRLRRFLPPQLVDLVVNSGDESFLESHRREIVAVFCDLRRFTPFAETSEPEEVMTVLREYHEALGDLVHRFEGTLEHFAGDGLLVFFNDPHPCEDPALSSIRMSVAMRRRIQALSTDWQQRGHDLGFSIGIAQGFATMGRIGFEGRYEYAAIGSVTNMASRLCSIAAPDQILVTQRVHSAVQDYVVSDPVGEMTLRGFTRPVDVYDIKGLNAARTTP
jgi:class 3 adenylate cyclase